VLLVIPISILGEFVVINDRLSYNGIAPEEGKSKDQKVLFVKLLFGFCE
jgi:hypothetical protein